MNENIKKAFPATDFGGSLKDEIAARAGTRAAHMRHRQRARKTIKGALATSGLIAAGVLVGPPAYALYRLNQIAGSLADCKTMVRVDYKIGEDGKVEFDKRTVYSNGKWRIERDGTTQIFENGVLWIYDPKLNQVQKHTKPYGPFGYNGSGASVKSMLRDITTWKWNSRPSVGSVMLDGRMVTAVTMDERDLRMTIYADPKTDMPIYYEAYRKEEDGGLSRVGFSKPEFNVPVRDAEFVRNFPTAARVIDIEKIKQTWAATIQKPKLTLQFEGGKIEIRDYAVNERGHVFIVYTNGETATDRAEYGNRIRSGNYQGPRNDGFGVDMTASDSVRSEYVQSSTSFQPYMDGYGGKPSEWVVLNDGQVLQGKWVYPLDDRPWTSRQIELKMTHGDQARTWTINVPKPTHKLIPEWFWALAIAPQTPEQLEAEEFRGKRQHYYWTENWQKFVPLAHREIERLDAWGRSERRRISKMDIYYQLYQAHHALGQSEEAKRYLTLASKEPEAHYEAGGLMSTKQLVLDTMKREGLR